MKKKKEIEILKNKYIYQRYDGTITKYIVDNEYYIAVGTGIATKKDETVLLGKVAENIIDLIEVGDYVNGYKVISIDTNAPNDCKECIELDRNNTYEYQWISRNEIETILTKELYKANCYTVERRKKC